MSGYIIGYVIGFIAGILLSSIVVFVKYYILKRHIGTLRVDQSDPNDEPYLFLELNVGIDVIKKQKSVSFDVNVENYLSQK